MNETKRIIVEFGARRQQFILTDRLISTSKLQHIIGNHFDIKFDNKSSYTLQMYDNILSEYHSLDDGNQTFDLVEDIEQLHRFRIISKSLQSQKHHLLNNLQSTVGKLHSATRDIDQIQNLVGALNHNCDILNHLMDTCHSKSSSCQPSSTLSYLIDPSTFKKDIGTTKVKVDNDWEDENFESVSCYDTTPVYPVHPPPPIPAILNLNKQQLATTTENIIQTRIIPCKYAVRGTCRLGDKCSYLHDETCIQSAREWERRL